MSRSPSSPRVPLPPPPGRELTAARPAGPWRGALVVGLGLFLLAPVATPAGASPPLRALSGPGGAPPGHGVLLPGIPSDTLRWDASGLEAGVRRYELFVQDNPLGAVEHRLEPLGDEWMATTTITSLVGQQETTLRFGVGDLSPRALRQDRGSGPLAISVDLVVDGNRIRGVVEVPPRVGESRRWDEPLPPGVLLPGMEEFALALAPLEEGVRLSIPYLDVTNGSVVTLEARVEGEEVLTVSGGEFRTWRVRVSGGEAPVTLFLRKEPPHILVRQEFWGQPMRLDLSGMAPLP